MSLNQGRIDLYTYLQNNWTQTPIVFGEMDDRGETLNKGSVPWIYADLDWNKEALQKNMSARSNKWVTPGILSLRIFSKKADGEGSIYELIDDAINLLRNQKIGNVLFKRMSNSRVILNDSDWLVCTINFSFNLISFHSL